MSQGVNDRTVQQEPEGDQRQNCPECESTDCHVTSAGEYVCEDCGIVIDEDRFDRGPEWRAYDATERAEKSRVGAPLTSMMHDRGLTTRIGWGEDGNGNTIPQERRYRLHRLRKWQERIRTKDAGERNLQFALSEIDRMASALGVPQSVREVASVIYRRALKEDLIRGRSIEGVATGALYAACREAGLPRSLAEMGTVSRVERREVARAYRHLARELDLKLQPLDPEQFVPRFCSELDLGEEVAAKARELLEAAAEEGLHSGKSPTGYAGAAIYAASLLLAEHCTQREIAEVAGVTEVTIRNRYQEQLESIGIPVRH